jgi:hypothetical protein
VCYSNFWWYFTSVEKQRTLFLLQYLCGYHYLFTEFSKHLLIVHSKRRLGFGLIFTKYFCFQTVCQLLFCFAWVALAWQKAHHISTAHGRHSRFMQPRLLPLALFPGVITTSLVVDVLVLIRDTHQTCSRRIRPRTNNLPNFDATPHVIHLPAKLRFSVIYWITNIVTEPSRL